MQNSVVCTKNLPHFRKEYDAFQKQKCDKDEMDERFLPKDDIANILDIMHHSDGVWPRVLVLLALQC